MGAKRVLLNDFTVLSDETINEIRKMKNTHGDSAPASRPVAVKVAGGRVSPLPVREAKAARLGMALPKVRQQAANLAEDEWEEF